MDTAESIVILAQHMAPWRQLPYATLVSAIGTLALSEVRGPSGVLYQIEVQVFWDAQPNGDVRVIASIDDGGIRSLRPLTLDFILAPSGHFVGEHS